MSQTLRRSASRLLLAAATIAGALSAALASGPVAVAGASPTGSFPGVSVQAMTCASSTVCDGVGSDEDDNGKTVAVDASSGAATVWSGDISDHTLFEVACPTSSACIAGSDNVMVTVSPSTGQAKISATLKPPKNGIIATDSMACASRSKCYAVGFEGTEIKSKGLIVALSSSGHPTKISTYSKATGVGSIVCPSSICWVAVHTTSGEFITKLASGKLSTRHELPANTYVADLACDRTKQCMALSGSNKTGGTTTEAFPFSPTTGKLGKMIKLGSFVGTGIACPSSTTCVIVGFTGSGASGRAAVETVTKGKASAPKKYTGEIFSSVACATSTRCYGAAFLSGGAVSIDRV